MKWKGQKTLYNFKDIKVISWKFNYVLSNPHDEVYKLTFFFACLLACRHKNLLKSQENVHYDIHDKSKLRHNHNTSCDSYHFILIDYFGFSSSSSLRLYFHFLSPIFFFVFLSCFSLFLSSSCLVSFHLSFYKYIEHHILDVAIFSFLFFSLYISQTPKNV